MSLSDPIADMLTRIRNAKRINREKVDIRASKICEGIAAVLKEQGYILGYDRIDDGHQGILKVELKYDPDGNPVITTIKRISKPGCRVYSAVDDLPYVLNGMGVAIISTSNGVLCDKDCREQKVSGEILCTVE